MLGVILSGGGALGAYEAGVLRYVLTALSPQLDRPIRPDLISGSSIGALNGAWIAARGAEGAEIVSRYWNEMEPARVYRFDMVDLLGAPLKLLRRSQPAAAPLSLVDPTPLYEYVRTAIPWAELHRRLDARELTAFVVSLTDVANGRSVQCVDGIPGARATATTMLKPTRITAEHCLASAAIPFVFPPVQVEDRYYLDGALRLGTPLAPAIHLGITHAIVIGVARAMPDETRIEHPVAPSAAFLAGKALRALTMDTVEEDLRRVDRVTKLLEWSESAYPGYLERLSKEWHPYRPIETVHVVPSEDLGRLAAALLPACLPDLPRATGLLLRALAALEDPRDPDLMAYLLFHHKYTGALEDLGYRDAAHQSEAIAAVVRRR